ncbi:uncharacterized protein METZ01_LOCUS154673 [marine metagenome]|uniref:Uncharacterized protein n=1 Tax=marine metagenome TaxID=408172 RepID=A0A382AKA8_9ZZZZ
MIFSSFHLASNNKDATNAHPKA